MILSSVWPLYGRKKRATSSTKGKWNRIWKEQVRLKGDPLEWAQMWNQLGDPLDEQTRREISQTYLSKSKQEDVVFVSKIKVFPVESVVKPFSQEILR